MKKIIFSIVLIVFSFLQLSAQESVKILLNDNERFRFVNDRLEFVNPNNNVFIGDSAGVNVSGDPNAINNVMIGYRAGFSSGSGVRNVYIGDSAGYVSTGSYNTYVGTRAGRYSTGSYGNSFFGGSSGRFNTTGFRNTYIGGIAGVLNEEGNYNTYVGHSAGLDSRGSNNVAIGRQAGYNNKGDSCVFIGNMAGFNDTTSQKLYVSNSDTDDPLIYGEFYNRMLRFNINRLELGSEQDNVIIGDGAGIGNTTGRGNVLLGYKAGHDNMEGNDNVFIGDSAGYFNTSGSYNTSVGAWSGYASTGSTRNSFFGVLSGCYNTTGHRNTYLGSFAGSYNDTGSYNVYVGHASGYASSGTANVAVGRYAGLNNKGDSCVFLGYMAGRNDTTSNKLYIANSDNPRPLIYGEFDNELVRFNVNRLDVCSNNENTIIGDSAGVDNYGSRNVFLGYRAGLSNTGGNDNIFIGDSTGCMNTEGYGNIFMGNWAGWSNTSGNRNVIIGTAAGQASEDGVFNVMIGQTSGYYTTSGSANVFLGVSAGAYNTTGSCNTYLGRGAGFYSETGDSNVFVGYRAGQNELNSHKLYIANTDTTTPLIYGEFDNELLRVHGTLDIKGLYQFPTIAGSDGNVLMADGTGNLTWQTAHGDFSNGGDAVGDARTLGNTDNYALDFITNNTSRLTINDDGGIRLDGNLGIFTDPSNASSINKSIRLYSSETFSNPYMYVSGDNSATIQLESRRVGQTTGQLWNITSGSGSTGDLDRFAIYNQTDGVCLSIRAGAKTGIATNTPSATLHVSGSTGYDQFRLETSYTPTGTSDANGNTGDIAWDDDYVYVKTSTGWKRSALSTW